MKVEHYNPSQIKPHADIKHLHRWVQTDERFIHMVADIRERGIDQPILITAGCEVVDGEMRRQASIKAGLEKVPCVVVPAEQIDSIILGSLSFRRHHTKGQRAYILAPRMESAFRESLVIRAKAVRRGESPPEAPHTAEMFAARYNLSQRLLEQARQVRKIFADDKEFAAEMEPKIFDEDQPAGLGAIIAGYAGRQATKAKPLPRPGKNEQLVLFCDGLGAEVKRFKYWQSFDDEAKAAALPAIREFVAAMPPDLILEFKRAIKQAEREAAEQEAAQ